jgi:hypothetical protein
VVSLYVSVSVEYLDRIVRVPPVSGGSMHASGLKPRAEREDVARERKRKREGA